MTKYIFHGGNSREINSDNDSYFREMTVGSKGKITVLLNYFSREVDEVKKLAEQDKQKFLQNSENKELEFEIADTNNLAEQIKRAYVMYMRGGETARLVEKLSITPNLSKLFEGKVISGSSAGVYVLAKHYWENDNNKLGDGLGIFNIKAFCHYTTEDMEIVSKLTSYGEDLPLLVLPNYKWIVLYK